MKEESTPYVRCEPAQTISVLLYSFNLPDFDYKNSVVCTRTQVHSGLSLQDWLHSALKQAFLRSLAQSFVTLEREVKALPPLFSQSNSKFRECFSNLQLNHELFLWIPLVFCIRIP